MKSVMMAVQHATRVIPMLIEGADGSPALTEGANHASVDDTAQGVYTVTFNDAFARAPIILVTVDIGSTGVELFAGIRDVTAADFIVEVTDEAGTLTDADVHILVVGFDSADRA